jgi:hypothetical protein
MLYLKNAIAILLITFVLAGLCSSITLQAQRPGVDTTIQSFHVLRIQGVRYVALSTIRGCFILKGRDTLVRHLGDYFYSMECTDVNRDGFPDILMGRNENTPDVFDLLLYDARLRSFKEVNNFDLFPDPRPIPGTRLFYSYHKNGCADMDWVSDLFYLDHYNTVLIGTMQGNGCEADSNRFIRIYKIVASRRKLMKRFPIDIINKFKYTKWGFIKQYWAKKYREFL